MAGYVLYEQKAAVAYITLNVDRTKEHLGSSDKAVIAMRRRLRESAVDLSAGKQPAAAQNGDVYKIRTCGILLKRDTPLEVGARERLRASA